MNYVLLGIIAFGGGIIIAGGLFAIITTIRLVNRFAHMTATKEYIMLYEEMVILGAVIGNIFFVYQISIPTNDIFTGIFGLLTGLYCGGMIVAIAEVVKALPIFIRRVRISTGLSYILVCMAVGKTLGGLLNFFMFK